MRHINRLPVPRILKNKQKEWQTLYENKLINNPKARPDSNKYGNKGIRDQLNSCSYNKCFYCESTLKGTIKEIDHHIEVVIDTSLAYEWNNLYLSCSECNDKLDHNTIPVTDILDPCVDSDEEIQRHITFDKECICSQAGSKKGLDTIKKYRLDKEVLDLKRSKWLNKLATIAHEINAKMREEQRFNPTPEEKNIICRFMQVDQPYSLMCEIYIKSYLSWAIT